MELYASLCDPNDLENSGNIINLAGDEKNQQPKDPLEDNSFDEEDDGSGDDANNLNYGSK
jgi:hypothetical protein